MEIINDDDQISQLPDDVVHQIFSFIDTRAIVQSGRLSSRWRNIWNCHPSLNFDITRSSYPANGSQFSKYVRRFLSKRDDVAELSTVKFRSNSISLPLLRKIIMYAMSHRTRKLSIEFSGEKRTRRGGIDSDLFSSRHLKHLFLRIDFGLKVSPFMTWDLPALTTLGINQVKFTLDDTSELTSLDLFSQFPNLKTLILDNCIISANIDTFIINSTVLESLSLINLPNSCEFVVSTPNLSSFTYIGMAQFSLSVKDLLSLKTVNFEIIYHRSIKKQPKVIKMIIKTLRQLYKAESLTLNSATLRVLSEFPELQSCPFTSLQDLTVVARRLRLSPAELAVVNKYFRRSSPGLKFCVQTQLIPSWMKRSFVF